MATILEELLALIEQLSPDNQQRVLEFAQSLNQATKDIASLPRSKLPPGKPGSALRRFKLPPEDVEAMERALEDCERTAPDEY